MHKIIRTFIFILFFLVAANSFAVAEDTTSKNPPITVIAEADKTSIAIGDKIKYSIKAKTGKNTEVKFPFFVKKLGDFSIRDFGFLERGFFGKKRLVQWYVLDIYVVGQHTIPAAILRYKQKDQQEWQEIETNPVEIEVKSVLEGAANISDIRGIKGPVGFPQRITHYIILGILIFLLFIILVRAILIKNKRDLDEMLPFKLPSEIAYEALKKLKEKGLIKLGKVKEFYIELSDIARHYLEDRFEVRAPEMTTEEFLTDIKDSDVLSREQKNLLRDFLLHCDMVKFARYKPPQKEMDSSFESAKKLIDQTKETAKDEKLAGEPKLKPGRGPMAAGKIVK